MKAVRKITSISLGMAAGLLGIEHAISEILQAPKETGGWFMHAIGAPCQPQLSWNACLPAITIFPQFLSAGIGTLLASFFLMVV